MAKYRIDRIADLARQLTFTPQDTRLAQVAAAEDLLHSIDPAKAYPLDFVVFRITGYRAKSTRAESTLLTGIALRHDLGLLIEQTSETLDVQVESLAEPVLTIDDVTERFNVTSKTIQRWRRKGLPARRFVFGDGKRRVGFLLNSVERFLSTHQDQVARGTNFSQVDDAERDQIIRRARRLAVECNCCSQEISRRIARKLNRSPLTILHTIRKHDGERPDDAIFSRAAEPIEEERRAKLLKAYRAGVPMNELAQRARRSRSSIYRIVLEERLAKLNRRKVKFIDDELYHGDDAEQTIAAIADQENVIAAAGRIEDKRIPRDLPPYLQDLYRTPLLTPTQERALFLKFNFHKYQFVQARRRLDPELARSRDLNELEAKLRRATDAKNDIVQANLRLVVSIARKHIRPGSTGRLNLMELISEGNITLMRAVESFDAHKGNRFSTYATLALMKGFARSVPQMLADGSGGRAFVAAGHRREALQPEIEDRRGVSTSASDRLVDRDEVSKLVSKLDDRERAVLLAHFGIVDSRASEGSSTSEPITHAELADRFGLSRQRIRQIEVLALEKLRAIVR